MGQPGRVPRVVYLLGAGTFVLGTTEFVIAGLLPELARDLAVSLPRAGLLISAFAVAMAVGAPLLTVLTLRLPRRATLLGALGLFAAGQVLGAVAPNYPILLLARVVTAAATGAFWAVAAVLTVGLVEPRRRARALSVLLGGLTVATVLGVPLGTLVGQLFGWRATFWLIAAATVIAGLALWVALPGVAAAGSAPAGLRAELAVFTDRRLWLALATVAVYETGTIGAFSYVAPVITDVAGLSARLVPVMLALFGVGSLAGIRIGGRFTDRHPWATLFGSLAAVVLALAALAAWSSHAWVVPVVMLGWGAAVFVVGTPLNARVFELAGPAPTLAGAATTSAFNVGNTAGPWLGGAVLDAGGGPRTPALVGALVVLAAVLVAGASWRADRTGRGAGRSRPQGCSR